MLGSYAVVAARAAHICCWVGRQGVWACKDVQRIVIGGILYRFKHAHLPLEVTLRRVYCCTAECQGKEPTTAHAKNTPMLRHPCRCCCSHLHPQARSQHTATADKLRHYPCHCVDRDCKAHAGRGACWSEDGSIETDQAASAVQQRTSTVACGVQKHAGSWQNRGHRRMSATQQKAGECADQVQPLSKQFRYLRDSYLTTAPKVLLE
jgi:hypothetical protein